MSIYQTRIYEHIKTHAHTHIYPSQYKPILHLKAIIHTLTQNTDAFRDTDKYSHKYN